MTSAIKYSLSRDRDLITVSILTSTGDIFATDIDGTDLEIRSRSDRNQCWIQARKNLTEKGFDFCPFQKPEHARNLL